MRRLLLVLFFFPPLSGDCQVSGAAAWVANGFAKYSEFDEDLYIGALYLTSPSDNPAAIRRSVPKRMEIKIVPRKLSYRRFGNLLIKSAAINNAPQVLVDNADAMESFLGWFKGNLTNGDHLVLAHTARGFSLTINGVELGTLASPTLFNVLLNTWIGGVPPNRDFKTGILGQARSEQLQQDFASLAYDRGRIAQIERWKTDMQALAAEEARLAEEERIAREAAKKAELARQRARDVEKKRAAARARAAEKARIANIEAAKGAAGAGQSALVAGQKSAAREQKPAQLAMAGKQNIEIEEDAPRADEFSAENLLAVQLYANKLLVHSQKKMQYPKVSRRMGHHGTVVASVTIDSRGQLIDFVLTETSKYNPLNLAVKKGIERAEPFPVPPDNIAGKDFTFTVPVTFRYNR